MKKAILSFGIVLLSALAFQATAQTGSEISLDKETHDYGTIDQGGNGESVFTVTNSGSAPLIISRCKGSCGCTVPACPKEPIAPGASASISVKYDTKRVGPINKSVTIESNATNSPVKVVRIKGTVQASASGTPTAPSSGPVASPGK